MCNVSPHVKRINMYVHTKRTITSTTIPSVMHVVPLLLLDTVPRCFLDDLVESRFSEGGCQLGPDWSAR